MTTNQLKTNNQQGQVLMLAIIIVGLVLINTLVIIGGAQVFHQNATYSVTSTQALNLAEAGVDKAIAALNDTGGSYQGEQETVLGAGSFSVTITTPSPGTKIIEATGYIPSKAAPKAKRTIKVTASKGTGVAFKYGVQVGDGGLEMLNDSVINGSVYSNGSIVMNNNAKIDGDAYVAGGMAITADQQSDCTVPNCADFIFGKSVGGESRLDPAQSFKPSSSGYLRKVALKLKKFGSPSDMTVRILKDENGAPDKDQVLASGTLTANLVTGQYGFVEVTFTTSPALIAETLYWIVLDTSNNSSNYWAWSEDTLQGYTRGSAAWSSNWQAGNPSWTSITGDLGFKMYMGGDFTYIQGAPNVTITGNAHANTLRDLTITKDAYYQIAQNITAANYYEGSADPPAKVLPISEANIQAWKDAAEAAGVHGGVSTCQSTLGPGKYIGNVSISSGCTVTVTDPIWITGNLILNNNVVFQLPSSYGATSGIVVVDGLVRLSNSSRLESLGEENKSFLMVLSTYDSRISGIEAIDMGNGGYADILYAPYGTIKLENSINLNEITAWKVHLERTIIVDYHDGLAASFFSAGPEGGYSLVKGNYQIK